MIIRIALCTISASVFVSKGIDSAGKRKVTAYHCSGAELKGSPVLTPVSVYQPLSKTKLRHHSLTCRQ